MNPESRGLRLGSGDESDVFVPDAKNAQTYSPEQINELLAKYEFIPDAQAKFLATLSANGYEQILRIEDRYDYPTLNDWVIQKIMQGQRWIRTYPAFIKPNDTDDVLFSKTRIKPKKEDADHGFENEALVMSRERNLPAPKFIGHTVEDAADGKLEMLIYEAIKVSDGGVIFPQEWTTACAREVVKLVKGFESTPIDDLPARKLNPEQIVSNQVAYVDKILREPIRRSLPVIVSDYKDIDKPTFVHGDFWPKNVIASNDLNNPKILFVDWESAGVGFLGQDAGRLWWGLESGANDEVKRTLISEFINSSGNDNERRLQLKFGVVLEALNGLAERQSRLERYTDPKLIERVRSEIDQIHVRFEKMIEDVDGLRNKTAKSSAGPREKPSEKKLLAQEIPQPEGETWNRIVVVSNRLPFRIERNDKGKPVVIGNDGGLLTGMASLMRDGLPRKWVGWHGATTKERADDAKLGSKIGSNYEIGAIGLTPKQIKEYYEGYCTEVLYPLMIGQIDQVDFAKAESDWKTYQAVQRKYALKVLNDLQSGDIVWIHDYQLTGVGRELLAHGIKQPVGFFLHTPFPLHEKFALLPHCKEILKDLLAHDIVGFQTRGFKKNFIDTINQLLPGQVTFEHESDMLTLAHIGDRIVRLGNFPIGVNPDEFKGQLALDKTQKNIERLQSVLQKMNDTQLIFSPGRVDYGKGFYEELQAFDRLLEKHPELLGKIILFQHVIPSRLTIQAYRDYKEKIIALAAKVNQKYRSTVVLDEDETKQSDIDRYPGMPVRQVHTSMKRPRFIAHLASADTQSVPTKGDGMNLIAKEGPVVGKSTMVQILGKDAGAAEELGDYALVIDPEDIEAFADAMYRAYTMAEKEKQDRKSGMTQIIEENTIFEWWARDQQPTFQKVWNEKIAASNTKN